MDRILKFFEDKPKWVKVAAMFGAFLIFAFMIHFGVTEAVDANLND